MFLIICSLIIFIILILFVIALIIRTLARHWARRTFGSTPRGNTQPKYPNIQYVQKKEKYFSKEQGEYIDFEEVK